MSWKQTLISYYSQPQQPLHPQKQPILSIPRVPTLTQQIYQTYKFKIQIEIGIQLYILFVMHLAVLAYSGSVSADTSKILKTVLYGCATAVCLRILHIFVNSKFKQGQGQPFYVLVRGVVVMLASYFEFSVVELYMDDYHYVMCGVNTVIFVNCCYTAIVYKHGCSVFTQSYMAFLVAYYVVRVCQYASMGELYKQEHIGFVSLIVGLGIIALSGLGSFGVTQDKKKNANFFDLQKCWVFLLCSFGWYFGFLILTGISNKNPAYQILGIFVHVFFVIFVISCLCQYRQLNYKFRWYLKPIFILQGIDRNIMRINNEIQQIQRNREQLLQYESQQKQLHKCTICKQQPCQYAQQCRNQSYYLFLCARQTCVKKWLNELKGKCQVCRQRKKKIYKVMLVRGDWHVIEEIPVNLT